MNTSDILRDNILRQQSKACTTQIILDYNNAVQETSVFALKFFAQL